MNASTGPHLGWTGCIAFDPTADIADWSRQLPPRWAVVALQATTADTTFKTVQLLSVRNLRRLLAERLSPEYAKTGPRRVDYRSLVARVCWVEVGNQLEADWIYLDLARVAFPDSYRGMVGLDPAWFVHITPEEQFPRVVKTIDPTASSGRLVGPMPDKHSSGRLVELLESAFELCRYPHVLAQAPGGKPCAYKEMGRCPAPCDGSISMPMYQQMAERAAVAAGNPLHEIGQVRQRMMDAAAAMRFESAGKIKAYLGELSELQKPALRRMAQIEDFRFLAVAGTRRDGWVRLLAVCGGQVSPIASLRLDSAARDSDRAALQVALAEVADLWAVPAAPRPATPAEVEVMGVVTRLMFSPKSDVVFLPVEDVSASAVIDAARDVSARLRRAEAAATAPDAAEAANRETADLPPNIPGLPAQPNDIYAHNRPDRELTDTTTDVPLPRH